MSRNAHPTKSGPGRRHKDGQAHGATLPPQAGGAWLGQRTNPERAQQRRLSQSLGGARQCRRQLKALRRFRGELRTAEVEA